LFILKCLPFQKKMKPISLKAFKVFCFALVIFFSCSKSGNVSQNSSVQIIVQQLKQDDAAFSSTQKANEVISNLDLNDNFKIKAPSGVDILFIKIKNRSGHTYLSIVDEEKKRSAGIFSFESAGKSPFHLLSEYAALKTIDKGSEIIIEDLAGGINATIKKDHNGTVTETFKQGTSLPKTPTVKNQLSSYDISAVEQDPYGEGCIDWYLVTYVDGVLIDEQFVGRRCPEGSTGGGSSSYTEGSSAGAADDGKLSCKSFSFSNINSYAYEAGISGLTFSFKVWGTSIIKSFDFRNVFVFFPRALQNGKTYTPGDAAAYSAQAFNQAALSMALEYQFYSLEQANALSKQMLETKFKNYVNIILQNQFEIPANTYFIQQGDNTVTKPAVWNSGWDIIWNGLSGTGCKGQ
jgi:hypothetical protein